MPPGLTILYVAQMEGSAGSQTTVDAVLAADAAAARRARDAAALEAALASGDAAEMTAALAAHRRARTEDAAAEAKERSARVSGARGVHVRL